MRMHLVSLPHTQVTHEYECCAYSQKVLKFAKILKGLGHTVISMPESRTKHRATS